MIDIIYNVLSILLPVFGVLLWASIPRTIRRWYRE